MNKSWLSRYLISGTLLLLLIFVSCSKGPQIKESDGKVILQNSLVSLEFNIKNGTYNISDLESNTLIFKEASLGMNKLTSKTKGCIISWEKQSVKDEFGSGLSLNLKFENSQQPVMLFSFILYDDHSFFAVNTGIENNTKTPLQLKDIYALTDGLLFPGMDISDDFAMVDGFSGGEPLEYGKRVYSPITRKNALKSRNNILVTQGNGHDRHTMVMGGLTYHDFEKYASVEQQRRVELNKGKDGENSLLAYLNLPDDTHDQSDNGPGLELKSDVSKRTWDNHEFRCTETATSAIGLGKMIIKAEELDPGHNYYLGLSWWRGMRHGNRKDHKQSVYVEYFQNGKNHIKYLIKDEMLPRFDGRMKEDIRQVEIPIPSEAIASGSFNIVIEKTPDDYENSAEDSNAYLSEIWLRDGNMEPLLPDVFTDVNKCQRPREELITNLFAQDPVGKRVDPGEAYYCPDLFYIDIVTKDPLIALEKYGQNVKIAQNVELSMYDFPSVCLWYAEQGGYGGGKAVNTTQGAVNEMKIIKEKGFLEYSRAAVRLVPDSYLPINQQGWWDDEHWQLEETDLDGSQNGRYVKPYETTKKWGKAVRDLGGIPLTYFQAGFRSEDYAKTYPEHMLFNNTYAWRGEPQDTASEMFTTWNQTWTRNRRVWGYDYTDPDFLTHLKDVYKNLSSGGVKGLMFDYPGYAWSYGGGHEDKYSTTSAAYRNIFRMPFEGLGPGSFVHERNMERGTDVSIGYVASMRTENDTDRMDPTTVTRCGMRWYKNRVLYNQDTDSKNLARLQGDRDVVRAVLTMAYVTTGRLLLANSFSQFTDDTYWDITRTFPYHTDNKSARPADAFVSDVPKVYDFDVNDSWHQVTFYNPDFENSTSIEIDLAGQPVDGALALNPDKSYLVYDFWNDSFVCEIAGSDRLEQTLRPGEARMMSVREKLDHPQVLSTNRHIMQGYLDMENVKWDDKKKTLSGTSKVVGGDTYVIAVAGNGYEMEKVNCEDGTTITFENTDNDLIKITISRAENGGVEWVVKFL